MRFLAYMLVAVSVTTLHAGAASTGVVGDWRGPADSVIRIAPCGGSLCATVVRTSADAAARTDSNNPNANLRQRPICGLQIGEGFHGSDPNKADGGHLYDPRSGKTYKGSLTSDGDVLLLRGYVGMSMFGRTARWDRVQTPVEMCSVQNVSRPATPGAGPVAPGTGQQVPNAGPQPIPRGPATTPLPAPEGASPTTPPESAQPR